MFQVYLSEDGTIFKKMATNNKNGEIIGIFQFYYSSLIKAPLKIPDNSRWPGVSIIIATME